MGAVLPSSAAGKAKAVTEVAKAVDKASDAANAAKKAEKAADKARNSRRAPEYDAGETTESDFINSAEKWLGKGYTEASDGR